MPNWRMFLTFLAVALLIMGGVHGYLFARLVAAPGIPSPWWEILAVLCALGTVSMPVAFLSMRILGRGGARFILVPTYVWLGFVFETFALVLAVDLVGAAAGWILRTVGAGPLFVPGGGELGLRRIVAGAEVGVAGLATCWAVAWNLFRLAVRRVEVTLPGLPAALDGFTIAQLSDLHLDPVRAGRWLARVVERTNALKPDLVAITGDLADGSAAEYADDVESLRALEAREGVYFVTGNHEYFHDLVGWLALLPTLGIRVLRNERVHIGQGGDSFDLAGVDDHQGRGLAEGHGPDLDRALAGRDPERVVVLLAHQPRIIDEAERHGVGLVLSGHTHGGQIWPFTYLVYLQQPYVRGLRRRGATQIYVSSGTGFWGPPMRLGTTAEIALLTLRAPEAR